MIEITVNQEYQEALFVFDENDNPVTGLVRANFGIYVSVNGISGDVSLFGITEVNAVSNPGEYRISFTPDQTGYWTLRLTHIIHSTPAGWIEDFEVVVQSSAGVLANEEYQESFFMFDNDGLAITGLVLSDFSYYTSVDGAPTTKTISISEVDALANPGEYRLKVSPDVTGFWTIRIWSDTYNKPRGFYTDLYVVSILTGGVVTTPGLQSQLATYAALNYSNYSFDNVVALLEQRLAATATWKDAYRSSTGQMLIELFAYVADMDGYKLERLAEELSIDFAQLRSSIVSMASLLGYQPRRKVSAVTTLQFLLDADYWTNNPQSNVVYIDEHSEVQTGGAVKFVTVPDDSSETRIEKPARILLVGGKQGYIDYIEHTQGVARVAEFDIPSSGDDVETVENKSVKVLVDGTLWSEVSSFVGQTSSAKIYTLTRKAELLKIRFGDDTQGLVPSTGSLIRVEWIVSLGSVGNVYGTGYVTTINSVIVDDASTPNVLDSSDIALTNIDAALGGEDEEDKEEIRVNAPRVFATGDRAVTTADHKALLLAYPGVLKAEVYGEQETLLGSFSSNPAYAWKIILVIVPSGFETISSSSYETLKDGILDFFEQKKVITTDLVFEDAIYIYVDVECHAFVRSIYNVSVVQGDIESTIDTLINLQTLDLGDSLRFADVLSAIDQIDGIDYSRIELFAAEEVATGDAGTAPLDPISYTLALTPLSLKRLFVYLDNNGALTRIGYDDGAGNLTSDAGLVGPRVTAGTINYATGAITNLTISENPGAGVKVRIRYQQATEDDQIIGTGGGSEIEFRGVIHYPVSKNSLDVYRADVLIASDDGNGVIVDTGSGEVDTGTILYDTGDVYVKFASGNAPAAGEEITIMYNYEARDLETATKNLLVQGYKEVSVEASS